MAPCPQTVDAPDGYTVGLVQASILGPGDVIVGVPAHSWRGFEQYVGLEVSDAQPKGQHDIVLRFKGRKGYALMPKTQRLRVAYMA